VLQEIFFGLGHDGTRAILGQWVATIDERKRSERYIEYRFRDGVRKVEGLERCESRGIRARIDAHDRAVATEALGDSAGHESIAGLEHE